MRPYHKILTAGAALCAFLAACGGPVGDAPPPPPAVDMAPPGDLASPCTINGLPAPPSACLLQRPEATAGRAGVR